MYFRFLRWLFMVNFFIFVLVFVFTVIPQAILPDDMTSSTSKPTTPQYYEGDEGETNCSALYVVKKPEHAYSTQPVIDFLQGTVSTRNCVLLEVLAGGKLCWEIDSICWH